jgi:hypothetical protein
MKKVWVAILIISAVSFSCRKINYKEAAWLVTDLNDVNTGAVSVDTTMEYASKIWDQKKIIKISSADELQSFVNYRPGAAIDGQLLLSSDLGDVDFSEKTIFVFGLRYQTQCDNATCGTIRRDKIKLQNTRKKVVFDFKIRTAVGGSGMLGVTKLFFLIIPNEKADYSISGDFTVDEYAGIGGGAQDHTISYEQ